MVERLHGGHFGRNKYRRSSELRCHGGAYRCAAPNAAGITGRLHLYAVELPDGVVKIGRTSNWRQRLAAYRGSMRVRVWLLTEEWADAAQLEAGLLQRLTHPRLAGRLEYLAADFDDVVEQAERMLGEMDVSYLVES
jgi:hypothetical protein